MCASFGKLGTHKIVSLFSAVAGVLVRRASFICHTAASQQIRAVLELRSTLSWS